MAYVNRVIVFSIKKLLCNKYIIYPSILCLNGDGIMHTFRDTQFKELLYSKDINQQLQINLSNCIFNTWNVEKNMAN